jgi:uncharacterized protein
LTIQISTQKGRVRRNTNNNATHDKENLRKATIDFVNTTVLPKTLKRRQDALYRPLAIAIRDNKVLFWEQQKSSADDIIKAARDEFKGNMGSNCAGAVFKFVKDLVKRHQGKPVDTALVNTVDDEIEAFIEEFEKQPKKSITSTARSNLQLIIKKLEDEANQEQIEMPHLVSFSLRNVVSWLNDPKQHGLLIVQAHDPNMLREFASRLAHFAYESRRRTGQITPLVSFVFDEADEFIPGQTSNDSQKKTKAAAMSLARRGRKFGLGIGIATQRIANLDVNTFAQPHTYFVSKLPRQYDRQAIAHAFGISEDMFRQTFKFKKGDWLLASYDAAGLEAIPIPMHAENAEEKIFEFLRQINGIT